MDILEHHQERQGALKLSHCDVKRTTSAAAFEIPVPSRFCRGSYHIQQPANYEASDWPPVGVVLRLYHD